MIDASVLSALNAQITKERQNAATYLALANRAGALNLTGVEKFMRAASADELTHAQTLIDYVIDRGAEPITALVDAVILPPALGLLAEPLKLFTDALGAEIANTHALEALYYSADNANDVRTCLVLMPLLAEQTASERELSGYVARLGAAGQDAAAVLAIDHELAE